MTKCWPEACKKYLKRRHGVLDVHVGDNSSHSVQSPPTTRLAWGTNQRKLCMFHYTTHNQFSNGEVEERGEFLTLASRDHKSSATVA